MKDRILSIDGGGLRGIIPCYCLMALEEHTGKLTRETFNYVAGTSTGALLAAAIAVGIPAKDILPIYTERAAKEIFNTVLPGVAAIASGFRYRSANVEKVLRSVFGTAADWTLNNSPVRLLLTAMGVNKHPWYFVRDNPKNARTTGNLSLVDCAVGSAAAPTYFDAWYVKPLGGTLVGWVFDGGVGVTGNPVYQACVEAFEFDAFSPLSTKVVSLGTGYFNAPEPNPPGGLLNTIQWTVDSLLGAPHDQQTQIVNRHYPGIMSRFDWELPYAIDFTDVSKISVLEEIGKQAAARMDWVGILG